MKKIVLSLVGIFLINLSLRVPEENYELLLKQIIEHTKRYEFSLAEKKLEELKEYMEELTSEDIKNAFPTIYFPLEITGVIRILEDEIKLAKEIRKSDIPYSFLLPWSEDFYRKNRDVFLYSLENFEKFNFVPDAFIPHMWDGRKVFLNFSQSPILSGYINPVVNFVKNDFVKDQIYFLPEITYISEALFLFAKRKLECSGVSIIYPKDKREIANKLKDIAWAFGISSPINIEYEGIDLIPFFLSKGMEILKIKKIKDREDEKKIFSKLSDYFESLTCVLILDSPRNSAAIIPQFRFIGARNLYFLGFFWEEIKDIVERNYFDRIFYADIFKGENKMRIYISELKSISDFVISAEKPISERIVFEGATGKISIFPGKYTTRTVFIFKVGKKLEKVFEYYKEEPAVE